ncbi:MAG: hypothetical protein WCA54_18620, partial [Pseudolabrys sp.]
IVSGYAPPPKTLSTWAALFRSVSVEKYSMSALGQKQTFAAHKSMSALPPKADTDWATNYGCPIETYG